MHTGNGLWKQQNKQVCTLDCTTETVKKRGIFMRCFFYILSEQIGEMCGMCVGVCTATQWRNTVCVCVCVCTWLVTSDTTEKYAVCVHVCVLPTVNHRATLLLLKLLHFWQLLHPAQLSLNTTIH